MTQNDLTLARQGAGRRENTIPAPQQGYAMIGGRASDNSGTEARQ